MSGWLDPFIIFIFYKIENNEALNKYIHIGIYNSIINMTEINDGDSARSLLERVLETQRQIEESFVVKPGEDIEYYGWYSKEIQSARVLHQTQHKFRSNTGNGNQNRLIKSPPYTYWFQGDKKILVTDVTNTQEVMERHKEKNAIFLGKLDKFCCRSFQKL